MQVQLLGKRMLPIMFTSLARCMAPALLILSATIGVATTVAAQPLQVFSEFARINTETGEVTAPEFPREILSPAVARNAFTSVQIVVKAGADESWRLYVAQNPEGVAVTKVYHLSDGETGTLMPITLPYTGSGNAVFWLDMFFAANVPAQRVKIEPQLRYRDDWVIYPMEARVMRATVPAGTTLSKGTQGEGSADPGDVMRGFLCGTRIEASESETPSRMTTASLRFRNAQQDRALAPQANRAELQESFGACDAAPPADDPEWYLRVRDFLYRLP